MNAADVLTIAGGVTVFAAGPVGLVVGARALMRRSHVHQFEAFIPENPDVAYTDDVLEILVELERAELERKRINAEVADHA